MNLLALVQTDTFASTVNAIAEPAEIVKELNFFELATKGGFIMVPILLLSIIAIYIFVERIIEINKAKREDGSFMNRIKDYIVEGKIQSAIELCHTTNTPAARMIEKGITRLGRPMNDVLVAIENVGNLEIAKLEKGFPMLATVAAVAPMIGFLGTVSGMIQSFYEMANAGNNAGIDILAGGIYVALVTTVAGLIVGIIALFAYNFLVAQVDSIVHRMEAKTMEFMDLLNEPAK